MVRDIKEILNNPFGLCKDNEERLEQLTEFKNSVEKAVAQITDKVYYSEKLSLDDKHLIGSYLYDVFGKVESVDIVRISNK